MTVDAVISEGTRRGDNCLEAWFGPDIDSAVIDVVKRLDVPFSVRDVVLILGVVPRYYWLIRRRLDKLHGMKFLRRTRKTVRGRKVLTYSRATPFLPDTLMKSE